MHWRSYGLISACQGFDCSNIFSCNILDAREWNGLKTRKAYVLYLFIHYTIFQDIFNSVGSLPYGLLNI